MLKKANINWIAKQLVKMVQNGTIRFDNAMQRGLVWDKKKKSLLIHSMLMGYPIPAFYAVKNGNGYDMLDGKQRSNAIIDFINGKFELTDVPEVEVTNEDGTTDMVDVNTLHFDEMEEALRDEITSCSLTIYYFEGITDDEVSEMFFRLNNGKALSAIELSRARTKSLGAIKELGQHELFKSALTKKAMARYTNEDIVIKSYAMLHEEEPSLETKAIRPLMADAVITGEDKKQMAEIYDRIISLYGKIEDKKVARRILTRTHMISIVPIVGKSLQEGLSDEQMAKWASEFFSGKRSASVSDIYNQSCRSGSAKKESVKRRLAEIEKHYNQFFSDKATDIATGKAIDKAEPSLASA